MAVGRLSFTPEQLRDNVKAYVNAVKKDAAILSDQIVKEVSEVVRHSPCVVFDETYALTGFELNKHSWLFSEWRILQSSTGRGFTSAIECGMRLFAVTCTKALISPIQLWRMGNGGTLDI